MVCAATLQRPEKGKEPSRTCDRVIHARIGRKRGGMTDKAGVNDAVTEKGGGATARDPYVAKS